MAATSEARALPFFTDLVGQPLESGFIYIGQAGLDPVAYPAVVSSTIDGSIVLAQPIRTTHGCAVSGGALVHMFVPIPYSITILDSSGRLIYASLNETDPVAVAIGSSSVQSAVNLAALRARTGSSTNQVWVDGYGMYVYVPTDNISPEKIPFVIVGNDGARYYLDSHVGNLSYARINGPATAFDTQGLFASWNDDTSGATFLTNNRGSGSGGFVLRTIAADGVTIIGKVVLSNAGGITADQDIRATGNLISNNGLVGLNSDTSRNLNWNGSTYALPGAALAINGSTAITQATLQAAILSNQQANGVGAVALGSNTSVNPVLPGTWSQTGTANNSVYLYVRVA